MAWLDHRLFVACLARTAEFSAEGAERHCGNTNLHGDEGIDVSIPILLK